MLSYKLLLKKILNSFQLSFKIYFKNPYNNWFKKKGHGDALFNFLNISRQQMSNVGNSAEQFIREKIYRAGGGG